MSDDYKKHGSMFIYISAMLTIAVFYEYAIRMQLITLSLNAHTENINLSHYFTQTIIKYFQSEHYTVISLALRALLLFSLWQYYITVSKIPRDMKAHKEKVPMYKVIMIIGLFLFLKGYMMVPYVNYLMIPLGFIFCVRGIYILSRGDAEVDYSDNPIEGPLPTGNESEYSLRLETEKGEIIFFNPFTGIAILGQPGSGKTYFLLTQLHYQCLSRGYSAFIYDYKGNPPTLGRDAFNVIYHLNKRGIKTPKFRIFNPSMPRHSVRLNLLDPANIQTKLHAQTLARVFMNNLDKESIKKSDFWAKNAMNLFENVIYTNATYNKEFSTLPHMIALILQPIEKLCSYLIKLNPMIEKDMLAIIDAYKKSADSQTAGVVATAALPIAALNNPEIFYLLSKNEMSLDISDPKDPTVFVACTDPENDKALQPLHGLISSIVMNKINQQGKNPCLFSVDELPTQFILNLEKLPATARSNKVVTCLSMQTKVQLAECYGKELADIIWQNLGNQIYLVNKDEATSKILTNIAGKYDKKKVSTSTNAQDASASISTNTSLEEVLPVSKIMTQPTGHAYGILTDVTNGSYPLYGAQVIGNTTANLLGIKEEKMIDIPSYYTDDVDDATLKAHMHQNFEKIHKDVQEYMDSVPAAV